VVVLALLALMSGAGFVMSRRRRRRAEEELHRAVGAKVRAWVDGLSFRSSIEVVGTLEKVAPAFIELTGDYEIVPRGAGKYVVDRTRLRIPYTALVEVSHDGETIHVRT